MRARAHARARTHTHTAFDSDPFAVRTLNPPPSIRSAGSGPYRLSGPVGSFLGSSAGPPYAGPPYAGPPYPGPPGPGAGYAGPPGTYYSPDLGPGPAGYGLGPGSARGSWARGDGGFAGQPGGSPAGTWQSMGGPVGLGFGDSEGYVVI